MQYVVSSEKRQWNFLGNQNECVCSLSVTREHSSSFGMCPLLGWASFLTSDSTCFERKCCKCFPFSPLSLFPPSVFVVVVLFVSCYIYIHNYVFR